MVLADTAQKQAKRRGAFSLRSATFHSSIYSRLAIVITVLSVALFIIFGLIFRSVYEKYIGAVIMQNGSNVGTIVEGALYHSMLENDKAQLQNTLDIINTMSGIENVSMYNSSNELEYTSFSADTAGKIDPDCKSCHRNIGAMFPRKDKSYRILKVDSECPMSTSTANERYLLIRSPVLNQESCYKSSCHAHSASEDVLGSLIINMPLKEFDSAVAKSTRQFYILAVITTLLFIVFLILFTRRQVLRPLNELKKASSAVAGGDRSMRIAVKPEWSDDMRMVSKAFNNMLDSLQSASEELENWSQQLEYKVQKKTEELGAAHSELIHVERLASLGKLSSSVAHEINNPLSGILIYTKLIYRQLNNPDLDAAKKESVLKHLKLIESETKRCGDIVKGLLDFSKKEEENFEQKHLHEILQETYDFLAHPMKIGNISFTNDFAAGSDLVLCSPNQVKQAFIAILVNASESITGNGEISIKTGNPDRDSIAVEISDNGVGISEQDIPHIFEPFFSTKHQASGIGLGLSIVHGIMQSHKSRISVKSEPGKGTEITVTMPLVKN